MQSILLYIDIEPYLAQWYVNEQGGEIPVKPARGSIEAAILETFLQQPPVTIKVMPPQQGQLAIALPDSKLKPPQTFHYLPPRACSLLLSTLRNRFDLALWTTLHKFSSVFHRQDDLIYAFMEKNGIEPTETNWNAIAKRYQRKRNYYLAYERRKKMLKKSSISDPINS